MNGVGTRKHSFASDYDARYGKGHHVRPSANSLLDGYQGSSDGAYDGLRPHQQVNGDRYSTMLNPNDPVSMHLLMEHALGDSQTYQVLSFEEIEELKKESSILSTRIDATKRKLAIETKIRDAAISINRLDSPSSRENMADGGSKRHQRNLLSKGSGGDSLTKTDNEIAANVRKCEDLSQELRRMEDRSQQVQKLLLQHTAGVLQMTHKGFLEKDGPPNTDTNNYGNGYNDLGLLDPSFDDRSFYQTLDAMLDSSGSNQDATSFAQQTQSILKTQQKLWDLNCRLRDAISQAGSGRSAVPAPPGPDSSENKNPEHALSGQIEYMEKGLQKIQKSHNETAQSLKKSERATEERLEGLNTHLRNIVIQGNQNSGPEIPLPPQVSGHGPDGQIAFLQGGLDALEQDMRRLKNNAQASHTRSRSHEERVGRYESTFQGLWQKIVAEEEASRTPDETSQSIPREKFSIDAFASKVGLLNSRVASLQQQKDILGRQIQQQREINNKSDSDKDARLHSLNAELEQSKRNLDAANIELQNQLIASQSAQAQLSEELQQTREQQSNLEEMVAAKTAEAERTRNEMQELEGEVVRLQTELTVSRAELDGAYGTRAQRAAETAQHPALVAEVAGLKEELAAIKDQHGAASMNNGELTQRVQTLQKELSETISEYELMTKSSIEFERERESLETTIDGLRDKCETLETELSDGKVRWMGMKSPGVAGDRGSNEKGATSTSVLKNEFKKMMRETRTENMKLLRHEQDERRKLEAQIRALKKDQTPGKSSLSQSMTAA